MNTSLDLPIITDCKGCGACCLHFNVPPFDCTDPLGGIAWEDREDDFDFATLPDELKADLVAYQPADDEVEAVYQAVLYEIATSQEN